MSNVTLISGRHTPTQSLEGKDFMLNNSTGSVFFFFAQLDSLRAYFRDISGNQGKSPRDFSGKGFKVKAF